MLHGRPLFLLIIPILSVRNILKKDKKYILTNCYIYSITNIRKRTNGSAMIGNSSLKQLIS